MSFQTACFFFYGTRNKIYFSMFAFYYERTVYTKPEENEVGERGGTELGKDYKPGLELGSPQSATALYVGAAHEAISAKKKEDIWKNASTNQTALLTTDFYFMGENTDIS